MPRMESDAIRSLVLSRLGLTPPAGDERLELPDAIGTVKAWRAWRVSLYDYKEGDPLVLRSATASYEWEPRKRARAHCDRDDTHVPGEDCSCGFYAARTLKHLRSMGYHTYYPGEESEITDVCVIGELHMWGKVIEGSQGWKSEFAYPRVIYVPYEVANKIAKPIKETYGVEVELLNLLDDRAKPGKGRRLK
jgi:hypothetical protein